tara:strand:- start:698 stop:865 length:168 start_codon:yes stop_codon:yes gene_type:complete
VLIKGKIIGVAIHKKATEFKPVVKIFPVFQTFCESFKYPEYEDSKNKLETIRFIK